MPTEITKPKLKAVAFKDEAKLAEAIEAFEAQFLPFNFESLTSEDKQTYKKGENLINQKVREYIQSVVNNYKEEKRLKNRTPDESVFED